MKAPEILSKAKGLLSERGQEYETQDEERSMGGIVQLFKARTGITLSESQGWLFMMCLKEVRSNKAGGKHSDSLLDLVSYTALWAEAFAGEAAFKPGKGTAHTGLSQEV